MTIDVKTSAPDKLLAYDGDCPMCLATIGLLLRLGLVRPEQTRSNHDLEPADLEVARRAGIRNQLVVVDLATRETRAGSDALLWIIGDNTRGHFLVRLLGWPGFRQLLRFGYETISYNRRVISPPRHQVVCDCEPEVTVARRLTLIAPLVLATIALVGGFGAAAFVGWGLGDALTGAIFIQIAAAGWIVMVAAGLAALGGMQRMDYIAHLVVTTFIGGLVLLPGAVMTLFLPRPASIAIDSMLVLSAFALMFAMQKRRVAAIGLPSAWLWAWAAVFVLIAVGSVANHFREALF